MFLLMSVILSTEGAGLCLGVSLAENLWTETLLDRDPSWTETFPGQRPFLDRDISWTETPRTETLPGQRPLGQRPFLDRDPSGTETLPG